MLLLIVVFFVGCGWVGEEFVVVVGLVGFEVGLVLGVFGCGGCCVGS